MISDIIDILPARQGHFLLESGHHGDLWLDLELLCLNPEPIQRLAVQIAARLSKHDVQVVCGPLVEGAFVALMVASELRVPFTYSERIVEQGIDGLYPVAYRLPRAVRGRRVAIVNDVINAGSAVRGTYADLKACGAEPFAIGTLAVLGDSAARSANNHGLALEAMAARRNTIWKPADCPLCARRVPLTDPMGEGRGAGEC